MNSIPKLTGGIGNRLFQYAAAAGLAEQWGRTVVFAPSKITENNHGRPTAICSLFPEIPLDEPEDTVELAFPAEAVYTYIPFPETPIPRHVVLNGYFQTERYFPRGGIRPDWDTALGPRRGQIEKLARLDTADERGRTWMIHCRFGDYLQLPHHQVNLRRYYQTCIAAIPDGARLHIFSDEPGRAREALEEIEGIERLELTWSVSKGDVDALYEMSLCHGGAIVANSTFSWWGAYFARASQGGPFKAFYPDVWGAGLPRATEIVPSWGERVFL